MNKVAEQDVDFDATETQDVEESQEIEVKIEDDEPEEKEPVEAKEEPKQESEDDDELSSYSESVQKRIKKLTWEKNEERRKAEEANKLKEEAVTFAQTVSEKYNNLNKSFEDSQGALVSQAKGRVESQIAEAKQKLKEAHETGDTDALVEAQEKLTTLQNEKFRYDNYVPKKQEEVKPPQAEAQKPAQEQAKPPKEAMDWLENNPWFQAPGKANQAMTGYALGVHAHLVATGVELNSKKYYDEIDSALKEAFPDKFGAVAVEPASQQPKAGNVVAPTSRTSKKPRQVKLTPSAAALAKRLGLTPEQYAAQLLKDNG